MDLTSEGFELGITRAVPMIVSAPTTAIGQTENTSDVECLRPAQDAGAWGSETTGDLLYWRNKRKKCKLQALIATPLTAQRPSAAIEWKNGKWNL